MVVEEDKKVERVDCHQGLLVERVGGCHQGLVVVGGRVVGYVGRCEGCHQGLVVGRVVGRAVERVVHQGAVVVVEGGKKGGGVVAGPPTGGRKKGSCLMLARYTLVVNIAFGVFELYFTC